MADENKGSVLVIGAGVAGMEASLLLTRAGLVVHLVEERAFIGGTSVLFEEVFPTLECATCMLAPRQQELLQDGNVRLLVSSEVEGVEGGAGRFKVKVRRKATYVDANACIGCGACYEVCPVKAPNEEEFGLSERKAIYIPFAGALPNVPVIDQGACLHLKGGECQACKEACAFGAVDFGRKDEVVELDVGAIVVAIGASDMDLEGVSGLGHGELDEVYTALEVERLRSSNGPSQGVIALRDGRAPRSVALVHCAGRAERGYCSAVCCMYLAKIAHYLHDRVPGVKVHEYFTDLCVPGQGGQAFFERMKGPGTELARYERLRVEGGEGGLRIVSMEGGEAREAFVDMVVLAPALVPRRGAERLGRALGIVVDEKGFFAGPKGSPISSSREGIYVIGAARGPAGIEASVSDAFAAVAEILVAGESEGHGHV